MNKNYEFFIFLLTHQDSGLVYVFYRKKDDRKYQRRFKLSYTFLLLQISIL